MQKMFIFLSLLMANTIPQDMAAGSAGGTVTVYRSRALSMIMEEGTWRSHCIGMVQIVPMTAKMAIIPTNFMPSL